MKALHGAYNVSKPVTVSLLALKFIGHIEERLTASGAKSETLRFHQRPYFPAGAEFSRRPGSGQCRHAFALRHCRRMKWNCVSYVTPIFPHFYSLKTSARLNSAWPPSTRMVNIFTVDLSTFGNLNIV